MIGDCRDRDGRPIPDDWYDRLRSGRPPFTYMEATE